MVVRVSLILAVIVGLLVPAQSRAAETASQSIIRKSCGPSYLSQGRSELQRMFANDDAANFSASLANARDIITLSEACSSNLPQCRPGQADCQDARLLVDSSTLLAEQYNLRALLGQGQGEAAMSALNSEVEQAIALCGTPGLMEQHPGAQIARSVLQVALKSMALFHAKGSGSAIDDRVADLQDCARHVAPGVSF